MTLNGSQILDVCVSVYEVDSHHDIANDHKNVKCVYSVRYMLQPLTLTLIKLERVDGGETEESSY